jgi:uncharacterized membrane protein YoaK (UPF0700 family)
MNVVLIVLTFVTGLVDAVTYLTLGHVFAANMTGNVIVLGFALVGTGEISATASLVSLGAFMVGGLLSAHLAHVLQRTRHRWIVIALLVEMILLGVAARLSAAGPGFASDHATVALLAVAMGMRTVTVRRLGISEISTTVVTTTLGGLAMDIYLRRSPLGPAGLRLAAVLAILAGAAAGAVLLRSGAALVLGVAASLLLILTVSYVAMMLRAAHADQ